MRLVDVPATSNGTLSTKRCVPKPNRPIAILVVSAAAGVMLLGAVVALAAMWVRQHRHAMGPPGEPALPHLALSRRHAAAAGLLFSGFGTPAARVHLLTGLVCQLRRHSATA